MDLYVLVVLKLKKYLLKKVLKSFLKWWPTVKHFRQWIVYHDDVQNVYISTKLSFCFIRSSHHCIICN